MSVNEFRGVTYRVGRNGVLSVFVQLSVRKRRGDHVEPEFGKKFVPEGEEFVIIKSERQAYICFFVVAIGVYAVGKQSEFVSVNIVFRFRFFSRNGFTASVPRDISSSVGEQIKREIAAVSATVARSVADFVRKLRYFVFRYERAFAFREFLRV